MKIIKSYAFSLLSLGVLGFASVAAAQAVNPADLRIRFASYNVENLFDSVHDEDPALPNGKQDFAFLPLSSPLKALCVQGNTGFYLKQCQETDWTKEHADWKADNAAKALSYISKKPDVITLAEVENDGVVGVIAQKLGYGSAHMATNSPDHRGIDVGVIYNKTKLKLVESIEIPVVGADLVKATRNILRAEFKMKDSRGNILPAQTLFVYANHWPSQAAPAKTRVMAAKILKANIEAVRATVRGEAYFVAMGDFNTIPADAPHPFNDVILNQTDWEGALVDSEVYARKEVPALNDSLLPGSYWFGGDKNWNKLDRIFVSQNLVDKRGADLVPSTFFILNDNRLMQRTVPTTGPYANEDIMIPKRFDSFATSQDSMGFSDHLPIGIEMKLPVR